MTRQSDGTLTMSGGVTFYCSDGDLPPIRPQLTHFHLFGVAVFGVGSACAALSSVLSGGQRDAAAAQRPSRLVSDHVRRMTTDPQAV